MTFWWQSLRTGHRLPGDAVGFLALWKTGGNPTCGSGHLPCLYQVPHWGSCRETVTLGTANQSHQAWGGSELKFCPFEALPSSAIELFLPLIFQIINYLCPHQWAWPPPAACSLYEETVINSAPHPRRGAAGQVTLPGDQGQHCINNTTTSSSQSRRKKMRTQTVLAANSMWFHGFPDRARNFLAVEYSVFSSSVFPCRPNWTLHTQFVRSENISLGLGEVAVTSVAFSAELPPQLRKNKKK